MAHYIWRWLVLVGCVLAELKTFLLIKMAPARARKDLLVHLTRPKRPDIWLLGTIHSGHIKSRVYSYSHLEAVLLHLRPTRLLVESRPEEIALDNLMDGPFEMGYLCLAARAAGIPFEGLDWWDEAMVGPRRTNARREDSMVRNLIQCLPTRGSVLVAVGFSHVPEFITRLGEQGYIKTPILQTQLIGLFDTAIVPQGFPAGMVQALEHRIMVEAEQLRKRPVGSATDRIRASQRTCHELIKRIRTTGERT